MFQIQLRRTIDIDVEDQISREIYSNEVFIGLHNLEGSKADCKHLQSLRERIVGENAQLIDFEIYAKVSITTVTKIRSHTTKFAWSNCLGCSNSFIQGDGLWFEFLNVAFNIGAKFTSFAILDSSKYRKAACFFRFAHVYILPKLSADIVPPELQADTLIFLEKLCIARSIDLDCSALQKWSAHSSYVELLKNSKKLPVQIVDIREEIENRSIELRAESLFAAGKELRRSRKHQDHLHAKDALLKTSQTKTKNSELRKKAIASSNEPSNRRKKGSLADLEEESVFNPANFFMPLEFVIEPELPALSPAKIFSDLLPYELRQVPLALKAQWMLWIKQDMIHPIYKMETSVRVLSVKFNIPVGIELMLGPGKLPPSLIVMGQQIVSEGGLQKLDKRLEKCRLLGSQVKTRITYSNLTDQHYQKLFYDRSQKSDVMSNDLNSSKDSVKCLLMVLQSGNDALQKFLDIPTPKYPSKRTKPTFLSKVEKIFFEVDGFLQHCKHLRAEASQITPRGIDFAASIHEYCREKVDVSPNVCYEDLVKLLRERFSQKVDVIRAYTAQSQTLVTLLTGLQKESDIFRRQSLVDPARMSAAHSLVVAWHSWNEINFSLSEIESDLYSIDTSLSVSIAGKTVAKLSDDIQQETKKQNDEQGEKGDLSPSRKFVWTPGRPIKIV